MAFQILPNSRGYDDLFATMVAAVPSGTFYDFARPIVMWSREPVAFLFETDNPSYPVKITRERLGDFSLGVDQGNLIEETTIVPLPGVSQTLFYLTLGRGRNRLTATEQLPGGGGRQQILEVIATTNAIVFEAYGREIFKTRQPAVLQSEAIYSPYATRLFDQLASLGDVLPDLQTLKILSTKMLIRSFIHFPATSLGVRNNIEAVTLNTPVFLSQRQSSNYQIETSRIMRAAENLAGQEAHIWFPNLAVTRWLAFLRMANTFTNNFEIESVRDDYVSVVYKGRENLHYFDYDAAGENFLTNISLKNCFNNISVTAYTTVNSRIYIPCWTYPLDYSITQDMALGLTRVMFDLGIPLDSGIPFDADPIDPFSDGFVGWSLSGRFEQGPPSYPLDSMVQPSVDMALSPSTVTLFQQTPLLSYEVMSGMERLAFAQQFPLAGSISQVSGFLAIGPGSGVGNVYAEIWEGSAGAPDILLATSNAVASTDIPNAPSNALNEGAEISFTFSAEAAVDKVSTYWLVFRTDPGVDLLVGVGNSSVQGFNVATNMGSGWNLVLGFTVPYCKFVGTQTNPPFLLPTSYQGAYTQSLNNYRSDIEIDYLVTASGTMSDYADSSPDTTIVGLGIDFPNLPDGTVEDTEDEEFPDQALRIFPAGQPVLLCVKYVDANGMTNLAGSGTIRVIEPLTGTAEFAPVSAGFVYVYYTPTVATTSTTFNLLDITTGTLTGHSQPFQVQAGPLGGFTATVIGDQVIGVPFPVTFQATDAYGNPITNVGLDSLVHILSQGGFAVTDPTPALADLTGGTVTVNLTMNTVGTGNLEFILQGFTVLSNTFNVTTGTFGNVQIYQVQDGPTYGTSDSPLGMPYDQGIAFLNASTLDLGTATFQCSTSNSGMVAGHLVTAKIWTLTGPMTGPPTALLYESAAIDAGTFGATATPTVFTFTGAHLAAGTSYFVSIGPISTLGGFDTELNSYALFQGFFIGPTSLAGTYTGHNQSPGLNGWFGNAYTPVFTLIST